MFIQPPGNPGGFLLPAMWIILFIDIPAVYLHFFMFYVSWSTSSNYLGPKRLCQVMKLIYTL